MNTQANLQTVNSAVNSAVSNSIKYIILEDGIMYDWDDYGVYGAVLYDIDNNKIFTTGYGHGTDMEQRNESIGLSEAVSKNIITPADIIKNMINSLPVSTPETLENISLCHDRENPTAIPVKVVRGRKFKGEGYLVYGDRIPVRYGLGAYRNEYNHRPVIFNPATGREERVNSYGYLEFDKDFMNNFKETVYKQLDKDIDTVCSIAHLWAYRMSYSACDSDNYRTKIYQLANTGGKGIVIPVNVKEGMKAVSEKAEADRKTAEDILRTEKLPGIIEWVKNNTDKKTEEDILGLAEHIFRKHYC